MSNVYVGNRQALAVGGKTNFKIYFSPLYNTLKIFWQKKPGVVQFQDSIRGSPFLASVIENATSILEEI